MEMGVWFLHECNDDQLAALRAQKWALGHRSLAAFLVSRYGYNFYCPCASMCVDHVGLCRFVSHVWICVSLHTDIPLARRLRLPLPTAVSAVILRTRRSPFKNLPRCLHAWGVPCAHSSQIALLDFLSLVHGGPRPSSINMGLTQ